MVKTYFEYLENFFYRAINSKFRVQSAIFAFLIFFILSFRPPYFIGVQRNFGLGFFDEQISYFNISETGFIDNFSGVDTAGTKEVLVQDENGNLIFKLEPQKREKTIFYTVKSGENISKIAHKFGLKISTILWVNDLNAKQTIQAGQKLKIPPIDGIFYKILSGDTLSEIAKNHNIETKKIYAYNQIKDNKIEPGQEIFLPKAKKITINKKPTNLAKTRSQKIQSIGFRLRRPTKGIITQGFHRRHFAIDIGNKLNTPIYAAAGGKVTISEDGWNYGYGKYVVIDHGNNIQTLYSHLNERKISLNEEVKPGQLIGLMGNTGNVWGPTGIHLHLELHIRGRKVNPLNYFNN